MGGGGSGVGVIVLVYLSYGSDRISTLRMKRGTDWPLVDKAPKGLLHWESLGGSLWSWSSWSSLFVQCVVSC